MANTIDGVSKSHLTIEKKLVLTIVLFLIIVEMIAIIKNNNDNNIVKWKKYSPALTWTSLEMTLPMLLEATHR